MVCAGDGLGGDGHACGESRGGQDRHHCAVFVAKTARGIFRRGQDTWREYLRPATVQTYAGMVDNARLSREFAEPDTRLQATCGSTRA
jgi:hypothetical protein